MNSEMTLGFLGTGRIAAAMVEGLCASPEPARIVLSPRNEDRSRQLAERWPTVERAASNQEVLDRAGLVVVALRPPVAAEVLGGLRFRQGQAVLAVVPDLTVVRGRELVQPAAPFVRALPLPSVARRLGPIPYYPADPAVEALLGRLGQPQAVASEAELHRLWTVTGLISSHYAQLAAIQAWCARAGTRPELARDYLLAMAGALDRMAEGGADLDDLAREAATPGGLNEMALGMLRAGSLFPDLDAALDAILARIEA